MAPPPPPPWTKKIKTETPPFFFPNYKEAAGGFDDSTDDDDDGTNHSFGGCAAASAENHNDVSHDEQDYHLVVVVKQEEVEHDGDDDPGLGDGGARGENDVRVDGEAANSIKNNNDDDDDDSVDFILSDYDPNGNLAFCCQNCTCLDTKNIHRQYYDIRNNCGNSSGGTSGGGTIIWGNTLLYHRGCCHGHAAQDDDYLSPMQKGIEKGSELKRNTKQFQGYTQTQIKTKYATAMKEEAQFENEEFNEDSSCSIHSNSTYNRYCISFQERKKIPLRTPLRILDLFSGIGSGTVVLKRLRLPISMMVHVEHDPVAVAVCKFNNDNDHIDHRYIDNFEDIYGQDDEPDNKLVVSFMQKYGPIDLVLSAAPCQNYSGLNAWGDRSSENAQYLLKVGRLIHKINDHQMSRLGVKDKVLFLSENVVFSNHDEVDKSYSIGEDESLPPMTVDAKDFGPCKRKRYYWINMPVNSSAPIKEVASFQSVDQLLDEGYGAVARLIQGGDLNTTVKANTLLASLSKIDDDRMLKYKVDVGIEQPKNRYHRETYSVSERERMMGLPIGYVQQPVCCLFSQLSENAFIRPETSAEGMTYRDFLPRQFWHFRRVCKFKFLPCPEPPFFQLALSSPLEGKNELSFFKADEYGKHLIGNGWSIPVVEHLLGKLRDLFAEDALITYQGYDTNHPWEPYQSM